MYNEKLLTNWPFYIPTDMATSPTKNLVDSNLGGVVNVT